MTTHVAVRPGFADLVDLWAPVRQIGTGFQFTEGPIWHPREGFLLFSDMPGDVRRRYNSTGIREVMKPANKCNGMSSPPKSIGHTILFRGCYCSKNHCSLKSWNYIVGEWYSKRHVASQRYA